MLPIRNDSLPTAPGLSPRPSAAPGPLAMLPYVDLSQPPAEGALAWLLAYGLSPEALERYSAPEIVTPDGLTRQDPGLLQAWTHAQAFYKDQGGPGPTAPACFAPPATEAAPARAVALYDQALAALTQTMQELFMEALGIKAATHVIGQPGPLVRLQWQVMDYLLSPVIPDGLGKNFFDAERHGARETFGLSADELRALLADLKLDTIEAMEKMAAVEMPDASDGENRAMHRAALDFGAYVDECRDRVYSLRREAGDPGRKLPPGRQRLLEQAVWRTGAVA